MKKGIALLTEDLITNTMVNRKGRFLLMKNIWKRVCVIGATVAIAVQCMALSGMAAGAPSYTAKYGTPSIDGKVSSGEYGPAQKLNKDNTGIFFGQVDLDDPSLDIHYPELTYQFAWNEQNLYVGVTIAEVENIETSKFQIDLSPEGKVRDEQKGVFFTFSILNLDSGLVSVARDNYQTAKPTSSKNSVVSASSKPVTTTSNNAANSDKTNSVVSGDPGTTVSNTVVSEEDVINNESGNTTDQESNVDTEESNISESQTDTGGQPKKNDNFGLMIGLIVGGVVIVGVGVLVFLKVKKII